MRLTQDFLEKLATGKLHANGTTDYIQVDLVAQLLAGYVLSYQAREANFARELLDSKIEKETWFNAAFPWASEEAEQDWIHRESDIESAGLTAEEHEDWLRRRAPGCVFHVTKGCIRKYGK